MSSSVNCSSQVAPEQRQRQILVGAVLVDLAHRHGLDHRHVHALAMAHLSISGISVLVEALERHGVDLDLQARRLRRRMPSRTLPRSPQRVILANLSGSSVSIETLMRRTPQSAARRRSA
jgi:hypothetical protein